MLNKTESEQEAMMSEAQAHRERVAAVYAEQDSTPQTFECSRPGFFAQSGYPLLTLVLLGAAPLLAFVLALMGIVRNGQFYPRRYGVYYPLYFWFSVVLALLPALLLFFSLPV